MVQLHACVFTLAATLILAGCGDDTAGGSGGEGGGDAAATSSQGGSTSEGGSTAASSEAGLHAGSPAEGSYLFALSAELNNARPILFQGDVAFAPDGSPPSFTLRLTPLRTPYRTGVDNETLEPLTALPPPLDLGPFDLAADGTFEAQFPSVQVTGKANPFSPNNLQATVLIKGQFTEDPSTTPNHLGFVCGTLEGDVASPIGLELEPEMNFFSMTQFEGTLPGAIAYNCAGEPAAPFDDGT